MMGAYLYCTYFCEYGGIAYHNLVVGLRLKYGHPLTCAEQRRRVRLFCTCSRIHRSRLGRYSQLRHRVVVRARQATWAGGPLRQPFAGVDFIPWSWIYVFGFCTYLRSYCHRWTFVHLSIPAFRASHRLFRLEAVICIAFPVVGMVLISEAHSIRACSLYLSGIFSQQILFGQCLFYSDPLMCWSRVHGLIESK